MKTKYNFRVTEFKDGYWFIELQKEYSFFFFKWKDPWMNIPRIYMGKVLKAYVDKDKEFLIKVCKKWNDLPLHYEVHLVDIKRHETKA